MKKSMMFGLMCAATVVCGVAKGETVKIPLEDGCDTLAYSVNGGLAVEVDLTGEAYEGATDLEFDLGHNGAYVVALKKSGEVVKTYNWNVTDAEFEASESGMTEAMLDTREEKTIAGTTTETITYSADGWGVGGSGVTVGYSLEGGARQTLKTPAGGGTVSWKPTLNGRYVFSHAVTDGITETAVFVVNGLPGGEGDPWEIGTGVTAYVKDRILYLNGKGEVTEFGGDGAPWAVYNEKLTGIGPLSKGIDIPASVLATLPISVTGGAEPSGAVSGAEPERIKIVDGKVLLGVSVCTNGDVTAATEDWEPAAIEEAKVEEDGTVTLTVPATAEQGFMLLKSKGAAPSDNNAANTIIEDR